MIRSKWFIDQVIDWATDNKHAVNPLWLQSKMAEINLPVPTHSQFTGQKEDWGSTHHSPEDKEQLFFPSPASPRVSRITSMVLGFPGFAFILHILILQQISGRCWQNPFSWIRHWSADLWEQTFPCHRRRGIYFFSNHPPSSLTYLHMFTPPSKLWVCNLDIRFFLLCSLYRC